MENEIAIQNLTDILDSVDMWLHEMKKYIPNKNGVVVDVGANVGDYIDELILINQSIKIHAFEPHPLTFSKLSKNTQYKRYHK
jgi:precorrin-6B methylase 2